MGGPTSTRLCVGALRDTAVMALHSDDTAAGINTGSPTVFVRSGDDLGPAAEALGIRRGGRRRLRLRRLASADTVVIGAFADDTAASTPGPRTCRALGDGVVGGAEAAGVDAAADHTSASRSPSPATPPSWARSTTTRPAVDAGAAYVFARTGTTWSRAEEPGRPVTRRRVTASAMRYRSRRTRGRSARRVTTRRAEWTRARPTSSRIGPRAAVLHVIRGSVDLPSHNAPWFPSPRFRDTITQIFQPAGGGP